MSTISDATAQFQTSRHNISAALDEIAAEWVAAGISHPVIDEGIIHPDALAELAERL